MLRRFAAPIAYAAAAVLLLGVQGCEKELDKIRVQFLGPAELDKPRPQRPGRATKNDPRCKGLKCVERDEPSPPPPLAAPMQPPPKPKASADERGGFRKRPGPPPKRAAARPKPEVPSKGDPAPQGPPEPAAREAQGKAAPLDRRPAPRPDRYAAEKDDSASRYLSPAAPKGPAVKGGVAAPLEGGAAGDEAAPGAATVNVEAAPGVQPLTEAREDILGMVADDAGDVGAHRIQISRTEDFKAVLFDRTYPFIEDADLRQEFLKSGLKDGAYWMRFAIVDLLDFQHPYSKPRKFRLRKR
ncbi:MAG: hypothetical protein HY927_03390 [Elusimicrobia bacterium]|nr:hypothetical protein [Elusimicrobiota bacterium]